MLCDDDNGSIPACAGEPFGTGLQQTKVGVYPRVCGGTRGAASDGTTLWGLSPRVRGNPVNTIFPDAPRGSIPACAGEPCSESHKETMAGVYPRVCGGTTPYVPKEEVDKGLSPRVRGNRIQNEGEESMTGSIPACAGEPVVAVMSGGMDRVYPRVCGGTVRRLVEFDVVSGSIPACAGEPLKRFNELHKDWVYPRVCGGTLASGRSRSC